MMQDLLGPDALAALFRPIKYVYPLYIASLIRKALAAAAKDDPELIVAGVEGPDSLGNSRYALHATDRNGTRYRITVEVEA